MMAGYFDVDLIVAATAYLVAWYGDPWAGGFALGMGLLTDVFSASPLGLFTLIHLLMFLGIRAGNALFDLYSASGQMMVVAMAVSLKKLLFLLFLSLFSPGTRLEPLILLALVSSAVFSALAAPAVFYLLESVSGRKGRPSEGEGLP
jgi:rod shape-determining protein MreD